MNTTRRTHIKVLSGALTGVLLPVRAAETDFNAYTDEQKEKLLKDGAVVSAEDIGHGVTKPVKLKLSLSGVEHSAQVQVVDKELPDFFPQGGGGPIPNHDSWKYNVAAYKLDRLLELRMVPVTVPRPYKGKPAAISWWVDDVMFEEAERVKKDIAPPDADDFARQRAVGMVFDELIINIDRNLANMLITKSWKVALIDHTRSFTAYHGIRNEANLTRCSRALFAKMKSLTAASITASVGPHLTNAEVRAVIGRRDKILDFFARKAKEKGEENVLFS